MSLQQTLTPFLVGNSKWLRYAAVVCVLCLFMSCNRYPNFDAMAAAMTQGDAQDIYWQNVKSDAVLIDVRSKQEYEVSHLLGALSWPLEQQHLWPLGQLPANRQVVVYCSVGYRSEKAAVLLQDAGVKEVFNLFGGLFGVFNNYLLFDGHGHSVQCIHGYNKKWGKWINHGVIIYD
jgi:rhodanese-related sulfurtransferase